MDMVTGVREGVGWGFEVHVYGCVKMEHSNRVNLHHICWQSCSSEGHGEEISVES